MTNTERKRKLGRGLGALMGGGERDLFECDIDKILPNKEQPRKHFDEKKLKELAESIKEYGIIQPIVLKKEGDHYRIIAGERRYRAAKLLGMTEIKAVLFHGEEEYQVSLIENVQREDLNPVEVAEAYSELVRRYGYTQQELARKVGKSRSEVSNYMRLLSLTETVLNLMREGKLSVGQARPLTVLPPDKQEGMAQRIVRDNLSARTVERLTKTEKPEAKSDQAQAHWKKLERAASTNRIAVKIIPKKHNRVTVSVTLDQDKLEQFIELIKQTDS